MMAEIQIEYNDRRIQYTADGGETGFIYDFPIYQSIHLIAKETDALGNVSTLVLGTDYTLTGVGDEAGGNLVLDTGVYPAGATADHIFTLYSQLPEERLSDYSYSGDFTSADVNKDFDSQIMMLQQLRRDMTRSPQLDITDELTSLPIKVDTTANRMNKVLKFTSDGIELEAGPTSDEISNAATYATNAANSAIASAASASSASTSASTATTQASLAGGYAAAAAQSAAEGLYGDVVSKAYADSPIVPLLTEEGTLYKINTSGGNVVVNLSALSTYAEDMKFAFVKITADANTVTINRGGTDTIDGATSKVLSVQYETHALIGDSATGTWSDIVQTTGIADDAVTTSKIVDAAITYAKLAATCITSIISAVRASLLDTTNTFTKAQIANVLSVSSVSGTLTLDLNASNNFSTTLTENTTLGTPSNPVAGQQGQLLLAQHASSAKTFTPNSFWKPYGGTAVTMPTTLSSKMLFTYWIESATVGWYSFGKGGAS